MVVLKVGLKTEPDHATWDLVSGLLYQHHSLGISEGELPINEGSDALVAFNEFELALEPGLLSPPKNFDVYFDNARDAERGLRAIKPHLDHLGLIYEIKPEEEKDYAEMWKKNFQPIEVGTQFLIRAPWHDIKPNAGHGQMELIIEPGMAFGTGSHETTKSCLQLIHKRVSTDHPSRVLDFGCGSGILAIALCKLGVPEVLGVDIDPLSIEASARNAETNGVEFNTALQLESLRFADGTPLGPPHGLFDGIVANVLKNTLIDFAPHFLRLVRPGGFLILSGLLAEQEADVLKAYQGFSLQDKLVCDDTSPADLINAADNGQMKWLTLGLVKN